jgi:hypothetical protein
MKLREHLFGDFHARLCGDGSLLQQNNIGQAGKNLWRDYAGGGIDQGLARVRWRDGVGENALAGVECVGAFAGQGFRDVATRAGNCARWCWCGGEFQRRKVIDRAGPRKLKIF